MQILQLLDGCHVTPLVQPAIFGSDLIAYSAAAKLRAAGSQNVIMFDNRVRPVTGLLGRLYFRRWSQPTWQPVPDGITISDRLGITQVEIGDHRRDGVVVSGELVPNSELAVDAGLHVNHVNRIPIRRGRNELSAPGWFVAGSEVGGFHGAHWCYQDGRRAAASTTKYLRTH